MDYVASQLHIVGLNEQCKEEIIEQVVESGGPNVEEEIICGAVGAGGSMEFAGLKNEKSTHCSFNHNLQGNINKVATTTLHIFLGLLLACWLRRLHHSANTQRKCPIIVSRIYM